MWDAENRLTEVRQGPATLASYTYDGLGRKHQKLAAGVIHTYVWDTRSLAEQRVSPGQTLRYVEGPSIDQHLAMQDGTVVTYYLADHLGSVVQDTNGSGVVTLARKYDPWGNPLSGGSTAGWGYTGIEWDPEADLYYYRARYYDPEVGRFLSEDPIGFEGGAHFYAYVDANPANWTDPTGLILWKCSRPSNGALALISARHVYFCNPATGKSCGKGRQGGKAKPRTDEQGGNCKIPPPPDTTCVPIPDSAGKEDAIMACCRWELPKDPHYSGFGPGNDCHDYAAECLRRNGAKDQPLPKFECTSPCGTRPPECTVHGVNVCTPWF